MIEKFQISSLPTTVRKRTFSPLQKFVLSSLWIAVSASTIGGLLLIQSGTVAQTTFNVVLITFLPILVAFAISVALVLRPLGPEADFELPSISATDPTATVYGTVLLSSGERREVEVVVPYVAGAASINLLADTSGYDSASPAYEEMFEIALQEVQRTYAKCEWAEAPRLSE